MSLSCQICLEEIEKQEINDDNFIFLPCAHGFHINCINKWLEVNNKCPICKIPYFIQTEEQLNNYNTLENEGIVFVRYSNNALERTLAGVINQLSENIPDGEYSNEVLNLINSTINSIDNMENILNSSENNASNSPENNTTNNRNENTNNSDFGLNRVNNRNQFINTPNYEIFNYLHHEEQDENSE